MRRYAVPEAYEQLKALTRGRRIDGPAIAKFVDGLPIPPAEKPTAQGADPGDVHRSRGPTGPRSLSRTRRRLT